MVTEMPSRAGNSVLAENGKLYEISDPALERTCVGLGLGLGLHESQACYKARAKGKAKTRV